MCKKIFLFLGLLFCAKACFALNVKQHMLVHLGIFDAAEIDLSYTFEDDAFDVKADVATTYVFDALYPFYASYEAKGNMEKEQILPVSYVTHSKSRNHVRMKQIFYDRKGKAYKRVSTKDKRKKEAKIINVPLSADAADLQTVFASFILFYKENQKCNMVREIYDGKKHYKVWGQNKGQELKFVNFLGHSMRTQVCHIYLKNLKDTGDVLLNASADKAIKLWIGTDSETEMPFLVEIKIDSTPLGALQVTPVTLDIY